MAETVMVRLSKRTHDALVSFAASQVTGNPAVPYCPVWERTGQPTLDTAIAILLSRTARHRARAKRAKAGKPLQASAPAS